MARKSREQRQREREARHDPSSPTYVGDVSPGSVGGEERLREGWTEDPVTGKIDQPPLEEGKITITVRGVQQPPGDVIPTEKIVKVEPAPLADVGIGQKVMAGATAFFMKPYEATAFITEKAVKEVQEVSRKIGIGETAPFREEKMLEAERKAEVFELEKKRFELNIQRITKGIISAEGLGQVEAIKERYPGVMFKEVEMPGRFEEGKFVYAPYKQIELTSPKLQKMFVDVQKTFAEAEIKAPPEKFVRGVRAGVVLTAVTVPVLIAGIKYQPFKTGKELVTTAVEEPVYTAGTLLGTGLLTKGIGKAWGKVRPVDVKTKVFTPAKTEFISRVSPKGVAETQVRTVTRYRQQVTVAGKPFGKVAYYATQRTFDVVSKGKVLGGFDTEIMVKTGKGVKQQLILTPKEKGMPIRFKLSRAELAQFQKFVVQEDVMLYEYGLRGVTRPSPVPKAKLVGKGYGLVFGKEATLGDIQVWQKGVGVVKKPTGEPARAFSLGMGRMVIRTKVGVGIKRGKIIYAPKTFRRATLGYGRMEQVKFFDPKTGEYVFEVERKGKVFKLWEEKGAVIVLKKTEFEPRMAITKGQVVTEEYPYGFRAGAVEKQVFDLDRPLGGGVSETFDVSIFKGVGQIRSQFEAIGQVPKTAVMVYTEEAVAPLAIAGRKAERINVSQMVSASLAKTLQVPKTKLMEKAIVSQELGVFTFQIPGVATAMATRQRTALRSQLALKAVTAPTPSIVPTVTIPTTPTGKLPFFIKIGDDIMKGVVGKKVFKEPKFKPEYKPSIEAGYFMIMGKKPERITGLELRPIIKI